MIFILPDVKNRVSVKNNDKISVTWIFLDPIKNRVSVKSVYVEAVYLEALLYIEKHKDNITVENSCIFKLETLSSDIFFYFGPSIYYVKK